MTEPIFDLDQLDGESRGEYGVADEYEYHFVEYEDEDEYEYEEQSQPSDATDNRWPVATNGCSDPGPR